MLNKKIAITGGIGSGKSAVSKIISEAGYKVYSCDEIYSKLLEGELTVKIAKIFESVVVNGKLDRKKLSGIVFSDADKLKTLTDLTNGEVIKYALSEMDKLKCLSFCEVPLLFENGFEELFDGVIVVTRNKEERIKSVILRDNLTEDEILSRIDSQFDYDNCNFAKYYVIHNNRDIAYLEQQTKNILCKIINSDT